MTATGLIDKYARSILASALLKGYDLEELCAAANVSPGIYRSTDERYGPEELSRISRHVKRLMDDEFCGMTRQRCRAGTFFLIGELILPCRDLRDALEKAFRFYALVNDGLNFDLLAGSDYAHIRLHVMEPERSVNDFLAEWQLLVWRHFAGWLIGEEIPILRTHFAHRQQGAAEEYQQVFASSCQFEQLENSITFRSSYLDQPIVRDLADIEKFWSTDRIDLEPVMGVDSAFKSRLRSQLRDHFFETQAFLPMESMAGKYNMSTQSLRRRLEEEGTSFRQLKEEIRREAALTWLRDSSLTIAEISRRCGFAEANGLSRAMKSWVGMSPSEYRQQVTS